MNKSIFSHRKIEKYNNYFKLLGLNSNITLSYLNTKFLISLFITFFFILSNIYGFIISPLVYILANYLIDYIVIKTNIKKRTIMLEKDSIIFFKVVYFSYNSNKNLRTALKIATSNVNNGISNEFRKVLEDAKMGKNLYKALKDFEEQIPSYKVQMIIDNINEAINLGSDVNLLLLDQISFLEESIRSYQERYIAFIPIKSLLLFIILIIPIIFIIFI